MKWVSFCGAVLTTLGMAAMAEAGVVQVGHCGAEKSCGCAPTHNPLCCQPKIYYKPVVCRPNSYAVHTYQRQCLKPSCCDNSCGPKNGCGPKRCGNGCGNNGCNNTCAAPACAAPACAAPACAAPMACAPAAPACAAPACAAPATCAPAAPACAAPATCAPAAPACAAPTTCAPACAAPVSCGTAPTSCGTASCGSSCKDNCCNADPCEIAHWIYCSQTSCYAKDRRRALRRLGNCGDCVCNPEIMCAFVYALNDADERVRRQAACEIGCQVKKHPCCCSECVSAALICSLGDCDKRVRRAAEKALCCCGYEVDDCCNMCSTTPSCGMGCNSCTSGAMHPATAPVEANEEGAPAPVPPAEPEAYFPSRLRDQQTKKSTTRNSLANLFGMRN